jgi:hypothetical protein
MLLSTAAPLLSTSPRQSQSAPSGAGRTMAVGTALAAPAAVAPAGRGGARGAVLLETSPHDMYWGVGYDRRGANHLGRLLMKVGRGGVNSNSNLNSGLNLAPACSAAS